jgi:hypothetical protein
LGRLGAAKALWEAMTAHEQFMGRLSNERVVRACLTARQAIDADRVRPSTPTAGVDHITQPGWIAGSVRNHQEGQRG